MTGDAEHLRPLSVVLAGGGSAGHVNPLLATADALRSRVPDVRIGVLGTAEGLEARLVSRFEWGMVADIGQPDLEHRIAILRKKQEQDHLEMTIPDDVLRFIAEHVRSNVRELEGCIIKLLLYASLKHKEVSIELAREALSDRIRAG